MNTKLQIILPGKIPGLLRRSSPLVGFDGQIGIVTSIDPWRAWDTMSGRDTGFNPKLVSLDLTDATGRAHAAWWLADRLPFDHPDRLRLRADEIELTWNMRAGTKVGRTFAGWCCGKGWVDPGSGLCVGRVVPALADLDPGGCVVLPDGSRACTVEALRRVILHVAGLEEGRE